MSTSSALIVKTRISSFNSCVEYAKKHKATKFLPACFFQGWQGYVNNGWLIISNSFHAGNEWKFEITASNGRGIVFYDVDRCHLFSAYSFKLKDLMLEITPGVKFQNLEYFSDACNDELNYDYYPSQVGCSEKDKIKFVCRPNDFPAVVTKNGFRIKWEARGVLAGVEMIAGIDEGQVIEELKKAVICWSSHLNIDLTVPF